MAKKSYFTIINKGEIHPSHVELLGASSKQDDPTTIGMFGSGIKYAIIESLRLGIDVSISTSTWMLSFDFQEEEVGEQTYKRILFCFKEKGRNLRKIKTSYTLTAGKNWDKPWYIIREFMANAMDERTTSGDDFQLDVEDGHPTFAAEGTTKVWIQFTPDIANVVQSMDSFMKTNDMKYLHENRYGRVYPKTGLGTKVFHKGMLVYESDKDSLYDYSLNHLTITEDRTARSSWDVNLYTAYLLNDAPDEIKRAIIKRVYENNTLYFENEIRFDCISDGDKWARVFKDVLPRGVVTPPSKWIEEEIRSVKRLDPVTAEHCHSMDNMLSVTGIVPTAESVMGKGGIKVKVLDMLSVDQSARKILRQAVKMVKAHYPDLPTVQVFKTRLENEHINGMVMDDRSIGINIEQLGRIKAAIETIMEEYVHITSGAGDSTRNFQDAAMSLLADLIMG